MVDIVVMRPPIFDMTEFINAIDLVDAIMVEIGSYQGESAEWFAKSGKFRSIIAVDPWVDESMLYLKEAELAFDQRVQQYPIITKLKMYSVNAAPLFEDQSLDMVYIDGDHNYEFIKQDIELWLPKVKKGGFLTGHDYGGSWQGVKKAVDEAFGKPDSTYSDQSWMVRVM